MPPTPQVFVVGSLNADLVQSVDRLPLPGETLRGDEVRTYPGGKGANQACAAGRMGADARMIGQTGDDGFRKLLVDSLREAGVDVTGVGRADCATGLAVIFVQPGGENSIVISPGANATLTPHRVEERLSELSASSFLLVQLEIPIETTGHAIRLAKQRGAATMLDPAPAQQLPREILECVDILTPNETEALTLLGEQDGSLDSDQDAQAVAARLLALGSRSVVLKLGPRGCMISRREGPTRLVAGFSVDAVDATAAGDAFNGVLASALAEGRTLDQAARFANAAAALSVTRPGAQSSIPSREETEMFLSQA